MVSLLNCAKATPQSENDVNKLTAKNGAFIGSSFSDPKFKILSYLLTPHPCDLRFTESPYPPAPTIFQVLPSSFSFVAMRSVKSLFDTLPKGDSGKSSMIS